ncbi:MAG: penicillin-binding protein 2 [Campylobacteraceae bacterium]|nr:penicillin-binding protein 2 [Campylobacteraceae bacterium]
MDKKNRLRTVLIVGFTILTLTMFLMAAFYWSSAKRNLPKLESSDRSSAIRGSIISKDGFLVANSQKLYKAEIDTRSIDRDKLDLFVKLYTIYTNDSPKRVLDLIKKTEGRVVLSYKISPKVAMQLKELARLLYQKKVFISFPTKDGRFNPPIGMSIIESGENREYIAKDSMSPFLGYTKKVEVDGITRAHGVKGVEEFYDYYLSASKDSITKGPRDIANNIILEKSSIKSKKIDGYNVVLNIPLNFQTKIEILLSQRAKQYDAEEIVVGILDSKTGEILTLATSKRYNPEKIRKEDYSAMNLTATEHAYEPGSIIKPIMFSIAYENGLVRLDEKINTHNGRYKLGSRTITDTNPQPSLSAMDVIAKSSNIGMIEIINRVDNMTLYEGLVNFNLSKKTGIDLNHEQVGNIPSLSSLKNVSNKATISYGYGLQTTFMQILSAFTAFNNDGIITTPRIAIGLEKDGKLYRVNEPTSRQVISKKTADDLKHVLVQAVETGTGRKARTKGLEIGGKTGTARIVKDGEYVRLYNSSFVGFINDEHRSLTMGVLVREPKKGSYYAAQNALPVFKEIIDMLIHDGYLTPKKEEDFKEVDQQILDSIED